MSELVGLGAKGLPGEVVAIRGSIVSVQAYEYTGGLAAGEPVTALGRPLSARLGPDLLGGVFDGLLRPLTTAPTWLTPDATRRDSGTAVDLAAVGVRRRRRDRRDGAWHVPGRRSRVPSAGTAGHQWPHRTPRRRWNAMARTKRWRPLRAPPYASVRIGRCAGRVRCVNAATPPSLCLPGSASSTPSSRLRAAAAPRSPADSAPARRCCCSRSRSGAQQTSSCTSAAENAVTRWPTSWPSWPSSPIRGPAAGWPSAP